MEILNEVIIGYRNVIEQRYQYDNLAQNYEIPTKFDEARVTLIRAYFLDYVYPEPAKREELNAAFDSLDNYLNHPEKLLRIVLDSASLVFKYGRHLPKIMSAGMKALKSFRTGSKFEGKLVERAVELNLATPFQPEDIETLIAALAKEDIEDFIKHNEALFEVVYDEKLVAKMVDIIQFLIKKMKKRPNVYSVEQVNGLAIGLEIIEKANELLHGLDNAEKRLILEQVIAIEKDALGLTK